MKEFDLSISRIIVGAYCSEENISKIKQLVHRINKIRFDKQKSYIMNSANYLSRDKSNLEGVTKQLWRHAPQMYAEVALTKISWNDKLELIERNLLEDEKMDN